MNVYPHGHVCGVFGSSHPYLRCYPSLNSDLLRKKLCFLRVARLASSQFNFLFCDAIFFCHFFSGEQFSTLELITRDDV